MVFSENTGRKSDGGDDKTDNEGLSKSSFTLVWKYLLIIENGYAIMKLILFSTIKADFCLKLVWDNSCDFILYCLG